MPAFFMGGRNRYSISEAFVEAGGKKTLEELGKEMLNVQKLRSPETAAEPRKFSALDSSKIH